MALKALVSGATAQGSVPAAGHTSVFTHNSGTYAVVTKNQADQGTGGFVILDISDPDNPTIVSEITDSTTGTNDGTNNWELLNGALDVETIVIGDIPYAVIAQKLATTSSAGGFTIVQLTDGNGDITETSPSVVKQVKDGDAFAGSLDASLGDLAGLSTQTHGNTTYLFTIGTSSTGIGTLQVYDLQKLIANDNTALITQKQDNDGTIRIDNPISIATNKVGGTIYAYVTTERDTETQKSYIEDFSFDTSTSTLSHQGISNFTSFSFSKYNAIWDFFASAVITNGSKSFYLFSEEKEGNSETHLYNFEVTNGALTGANYSSNVKSTSPSVTLDDVNQLSTAIVDGKYYFIAPNSGSTNKGLEAIEVNMSSGALASEGSIAIDGSTDVEGATFSSLDGATDFASFTVGSSVYGLTTAKTDQAVQIFRLIHVSSLASATYDFATGTLVFTGEDLVAKTGSDNDIDVSKFTFTGEDSNTYSLTSNDVEIDSATQFTISLNEADQLQLAGLLNKVGTSSGGGTTYNIAVTSGWNPGNTWSPDDLTGNAITVSNVAAPTLTSASYDLSTGVLVITGTNLPAYPGAANDLDVSSLTITGEGGNTYTLTSDDVELSSSTSATVTLNSTDQTQLAGLLDQTGTASSDGTTYNIAAADRWVPGADSTINSSDLTGNGITVTVNAAPVTGSTGGTLAFTEGDGATVIDSSLTITDDDDSNIESATVTISSGFQSAEDVLSFSNTSAITGAWNASTGVLTLTGSDSLANYKAALESVTYNNTSDNPNTDNRTISWVVNDGTDSSAAVTSTVTITAVNDAPVLSTPTAGAISETADSSDTTTSGLTGTLSASDADGDTLTYGFTSAHSFLTSDGTTTEEGSYGSLSLNTSTGAYSYTPNSAAVEALDDSDSATDSFTLTASDGIETTSATYTVNLTGADDSSVITATTTDSITEDSGTFTVSGSISIADPDANDSPSFPDVDSTTSDNAYGSYSLSNGTWSYTLSNPPALAAGASTTDTFTLTATDGSTQEITITIKDAIEGGSKPPREVNNNNFTKFIFDRKNSGFQAEVGDQTIIKGRPLSNAQITGATEGDEDTVNIILKNNGITNSKFDVQGGGGLNLKVQMKSGNPRQNFRPFFSKNTVTGSDTNDSIQFTKARFIGNEIDLGKGRDTAKFGKQVKYLGENTVKLGSALDNNGETVSDGDIDIVKFKWDNGSNVSATAAKFTITEFGKEDKIIIKDNGVNTTLTYNDLKQNPDLEDDYFQIQFLD